MNTTTLTTPAPAAVASPYRRRTPTLLQAIGRAVWSAMEDMGRRRAARELNQLAQRWEPFDPALAQQLREASLHDTTAGKEKS